MSVLGLFGGAGLLADAGSGWVGAWRSWEVAVVVLAVAAALALLGAVYAWYLVQLRRAELAALESDDQAARLLGEALGRCPTYIRPEFLGEVWAAFSALPSAEKRALAQAVVGLLSGGSLGLIGVDLKLGHIVRGFRRVEKAGPPATEEEAEECLTRALDRAGVFLGEAAAAEVWAHFRALPRQGKGWLAVRLDVLLAATDVTRQLELDHPVLSVAREAREFFAADSPTPSPAATP